MTTTSQYLQKAKQMRSKLLDESVKIVYANENKITSMNIQNIDEHRGSDGQALKNTNRKYSGRYTLATQLIASTERPIAPKIAGDLYNWTWTGNFINNFQVEVLSNKMQIEIFSTGSGSGLKKTFFDGYKNIYGLTKEDQIKLNMDIIYPEIMTFINQYI